LPVNWRLWWEVVWSRDQGLWAIAFPGGSIETEARQGLLGVRELAVTCRVLKIAKHPFSRWLKSPASDLDWDDAQPTDAAIGWLFSLVGLMALFTL
jgi:hypothetical protein